MVAGSDWRQLVLRIRPSWYERRFTESLFIAGLLILIICFAQSLNPQMNRNARLQRPWTFRLDLNTATKSEFEMLPAVGPHLAAQMIEFKRRLPNRRFTHLEQLFQVKGLGPLTVEKIRNHITLTEAP